MSSQSQASLNIVAQLLGLDGEELNDALVSRVMQATRGGTKGTVIKVPLKTGEAQSARDALAKSIYSRLFDYIVTRVNKALPFSGSKNYIGVLDIAGFGEKKFFFFPPCWIYSVTSWLYCFNIMLYGSDT